MGGQLGRKVIKLLKMMRVGSQDQVQRSAEALYSGIYAVKVSNFDPQISPPPKSPLRNSTDKIMQKKDVLLFGLNHSIRELRSKQRHPKSQHQHQRYLSELTSSDPPFGGLLRERIRVMAGRSQASAYNEDRERNVHFSEFVMKEMHCTGGGAVSARVKKNNSVLKSMKARNLLSRSMYASKSAREEDSFKSIELNNQSKYAHSRKIVPSQQHQQRPVTQRHHRTQPQQVRERGVRAILGVSTGEGRRKKVEDECRPWETKGGEHCQEEHLMNM